MEQLLQIKTIPVNYELTVHNARLEIKSGTAELEISRDKGGMHIKSRPVKLNIDTFEARNSVVPTVATAIKQAASRGKSASYEATAQYASEGKLMLKTQIGEGNEMLNQIIGQRVAQPEGNFNIKFIPSQGAKFSYEAPSLSIEYEMDKLQFDLKVEKGRVDFIPGTIELSITQQPDVIIEYVGKPIYVPPSVAAHFNGENINVKA